MKPILLVTGGSRGNRRGTARLAAARGYAVCLSYAAMPRRPPRWWPTSSAPAARRSPWRDVASEPTWLRLFETVDARLAAHGAGEQRRHPRAADDPAEHDAARWQRVLATTLIGSFLCAREGGAPHVEQAGRRRRRDRQRLVDGGQARLARRVRRLRGLEGRDRLADHRLAKEVAAEGIRVNAVRPGVIYTEIHASGGEPGRVDRVKAAVRCSGAAPPRKWRGDPVAAVGRSVVLDRRLHRRLRGR